MKHTLYKPQPGTVTHIDDIRIFFFATTYSMIEYTTFYTRALITAEPIGTYSTLIIE